jgi:cellulose synthase (UDP-forming)
MFDIKDAINRVYNYQYIRTGWKIRLSNFIALVCFSLVAVGFYFFLGGSIIRWILFGIPITIFVITYLLNYLINLRYPQFYVDSHEEFVNWYFRETSAVPTVDIFLPICGEDWDVLRRTWDAVRHVNYDWDKLNVYVLDDGGSDDVKQKAEQYGFTYFVRENRGYLKKAGNLKAGFEISSGDIIVILDADFAPDPNFLTHTIPYFSQRSTALVQTPQYFNLKDQFHSNKLIAYGAGYVQDDFYKYIQPSRGSFNAAICVGSNCLYRRASMEEIGGFPQVDHSEDIITGLKIQELPKNNQLIFLPIVVATGLCPDDVQSYLSQQIRWCKGTLEFVGSKQFWLSKLNIIQKLGYLNGWFYYISNLTEKILAFIPLFVLLSDTGVSVGGMLLFWPFTIYTWFLKPMLHNYRENMYASINFNMLSFMYAFAVFREIFGIQYVWKASGTKSKGRQLLQSFYFFFLTIFVLLLSSFIFLFFNVSSIALNIATVFLLIWLSYYIIFKNLQVFFFLTFNLLKPEPKN